MMIKLFKEESGGNLSPLGYLLKDRIAPAYYDDEAGCVVPCDDQFEGDGKYPYVCINETRKHLPKNGGGTFYEGAVILLNSYNSGRWADGELSNFPTWKISRYELGRFGVTDEKKTIETKEALERHLEHCVGARQWFETSGDMSYKNVRDRWFKLMKLDPNNWKNLAEVWSTSPWMVPLSEWKKFYSSVFK